PSIQNPTWVISVILDTNIPEIAQLLPGIPNRIPKYTLQEKAKVKILIGSFEVQSRSQFRITHPDPGPVKNLIDHPITIQILITDPSHTFTRLYRPIIHLFLRLVDAICHQSIHRIQRPPNNIIQQSISTKSIL